MRWRERYSIQFTIKMWQHHKEDNQWISLNERENGDSKQYPGKAIMRINRKSDDEDK